MKSSVNIRFFRNGSVLVRISFVPYKYVLIYMCPVKDTYYIRIRKCAQQLEYMKVRRTMKNEVCCALFTVHQFPWGSGNVLFFCSPYPQASQVCRDRSSALNCWDTPWTAILCDFIVCDYVISIWCTDSPVKISELFRKEAALISAENFRSEQLLIADKPAWHLRDLQCWSTLLLSKRSFQPKFCIIWLWEALTSRRRSPWELSSFVPWFVPSAFRDVSGKDPEWLWINGFRRNSSSQETAPKMQFSVLQNFWDSFFVTIPSLFSETWVI